MPGAARLARATALIVSAAVATTLAVPARARVLVTVDEALALAFPGARIERRTIFLTEAQRARATELAGQPPAAAIVHPYVATRDGEIVGTAYFDTHVVRTLAETVMIAVDREGRVGRVEVLSFDEPPDYLPREPWYRQFDQRTLDAELELRRSIRPVSGATLTARATTDAVRRVLALHRALAEPAANAEALGEGARP
jgi:hypothetical protein